MPLLAFLAKSILGFFAFILRFLTGFWSNLALFIAFMIPNILGVVIKLLGIGVVSFIGFNVVITGIKAFVVSRYQGIPSDLLQILSLMKVDTGIALVFAAMSIALTIKMTTKATTVVWRKPGSGSGGSMPA